MVRMAQHEVSTKCRKCGSQMDHKWLTAPSDTDTTGHVSEWWCKNCNQSTIQDVVKDYYPIKIKKPATEDEWLRNLESAKAELKHVEAKAEGIKIRIREIEGYIAKFKNSSSASVVKED